MRSHTAPSRFRSHLEEILLPAGVRIGGERPWDPQIHDPRVYRAAWWRGTLGLGEAYVRGWWDCAALDELFARVLRVGLDRRLRSAADARSWLSAWLNRQRPSRARVVSRRHYDLGNDLFEAMLDARMIYSCGYWRDATSLDAAQVAKLRLVGDKLHLKPGMRVLDIGCGWGGAARFLAEQFQVEVVGVTNSAEQAAYARQNSAGGPVEILAGDYREVRGRFDRIYSLGMFEHVGYRNHERFFDCARECLHPDGLLLLHTIGSLSTNRYGDPWIERYVFPNSLLPSAVQIARAVESRFVIEDWHNFGADYDRTLMQWDANVRARWAQLAHYGPRFRRLWHYYLRTCAGTFRARRNQLWQVVLSPAGVPGGYRSLR